VAERTTVFVSYCRRNNRWLERLKVHLKPYDRDLDVWDDTRIDPGARWRSEISAAIDRAAASVVLISADFLASEFVVVHELPKLLHKAADAGASILPIFIEPCELARYPELESIQGINSPKKPLAEMSRVEAERVLVRAAEAIGRVLASPRLPVPRMHSDRKGPVNGHVQDVFEPLQAATITLSLLWALNAEGKSCTLSELEEQLDIRSRKRAYEALNQLASAGWIEKGRTSGLMKYHIAAEGVRQWKRLSAVCDGPVRRASAAR
jgi:hypothetical protein